MWTIYVLHSQKSGKRYVGMTADVNRRLAEHNASKSKFTSGHVPWILIYTETAGDSKQARQREKYFKSAAGRKYIEQQLNRAGSLPE